MIQPSKVTRSKAFCRPSIGIFDPLRGLRGLLRTSDLAPSSQFPSKCPHVRYPISLGATSVQHVAHLALAAEIKTEISQTRQNCPQIFHRPASVGIVERKSGEQEEGEKTQGMGGAETSEILQW